ncbi:Hypothetical predicted protein [Paramuricea clavata]|uniref:Uncharacterized protein n=1 Tax=Paramuricea clavata TaxID=317549 RepID=A0A6S7IPK3_PARCT|nr:Hypothetical predicted protein [Paramuricea clavata]
MADLAKPRKIRGGHRGYLTKILAQVTGMLENFNEELRIEASQLREGIVDAVTIIHRLDDEIVELIASDKDLTEEDIMKEIEDAGKLRADARKIVKKLDEKLCENNVTSVVESSAGSTSNESATTASKVRAKFRYWKLKDLKRTCANGKSFGTRSRVQ